MSANYISIEVEFLTLQFYNFFTILQKCGENSGGFSFNKKKNVWISQKVRMCKKINKNSMVKMSNTKNRKKIKFLHIKQ